jgi:glycosyltransferase involved in cell wall biosynthesis
MEGVHTRDSHIIEHLGKRADVDTVLVINRPISYTEIFLKRRSKKLKGKIVLRYKNATLYQVAEKTFVLDYISNDILGPIIQKKTWFFQQFDALCLFEAYKRSLDFLNLKQSIVIAQSVFASKFVSKLTEPCVFDAWDNVLLFPSNSSMRDVFFQAYQSMAKMCPVWITNSDENIKYYKTHYNVEQCFLVKNGVDVDIFEKEYPMPHDLVGIPRPIIGFGGRISHLVDFKLLNYLTEKHSEKSFVLIGELLAKEVFEKIEQRKNVYYLGNKTYSEYIAYIKNFDIGIVPYVVQKLQHGGDSIKVYEYLAAGLKVVGVPAGGMQDLGEYIFLSKTSEEFSDNIDKALSSKETICLSDFYTWNNKVNTIINILKSSIK